MENAETLSLERQKTLTPIHEAGHVIGAKFCEMEVVVANIHTQGNQCGVTTVVPMGADYSKINRSPLE